MTYHAASVGWPLDGAGGDERVIFSCPGVPEEPRIAPHLFAPHRAFGPLLVVSWVGFYWRVLRVLALAYQIRRRSQSRTLNDGVVFDAHPCVKHVPPAPGPDHAPGPDGAIVPGPRRASVKGVWQDTPVPQVLRDGVTDGGVQMPQLRVTQRAGRLKVERVVVRAVTDQPEVPHPLIGKLQGHL